MATNCPEPRGPTRRSGVFSRSGSYTDLIPELPLQQSRPVSPAATAASKAVLTFAMLFGFVPLGSIFRRTPSST